MGITQVILVMILTTFLNTQININATYQKSKSIFKRDYNVKRNSFKFTLPMPKDIEEKIRKRQLDADILPPYEDLFLNIYNNPTDTNNIESKYSEIDVSSKSKSFKSDRSLVQSNTNTIQQQRSDPGLVDSGVTRKFFYTFSAPSPPPVEEEKVKRLVLGRRQKNYKIVFIKVAAPKLPILHIEEAPRDLHTAIYVLNKESEEPKIEAIQSDPTPPSKPEVHFIKYKTPEEATFAQNKIQAFYDTLGGTTEVSDEGIAPSASVIGSLTMSSNPRNELKTEVSLNSNILSNSGTSPENNLNNNYLSPYLFT